MADHDDLIKFLEDTVARGKKILAGIEGGDRYQALDGTKWVDTTDGDKKYYTDQVERSEKHIKKLKQKAD